MAAASLRRIRYVDEKVETLLLGMLGTSERLERVWDSGSDHLAELAEINDTLVDLTGLLGGQLGESATWSFAERSGCRG